MTPMTDDASREKRLRKLVASESPRDRGTRGLARSAALSGGLTGERSRFVAQWVPYCLSPREITRYTDPRSVADKTVEVTALVPCRKCDNCRQYRRLQWKERIKQELIRASASYLVTLTFSDIHIAGIIMESLKYNGYQESEAFEKAAYRHVQLYLKRVRKAGAELRYAAFFEHGEKTGRPHYHIVVHQSGSAELERETFKLMWRSFVDFRPIITEDYDIAAGYVTKYLTKSKTGVVRASFSYGTPSGDQDTQPGPQRYGCDLAYQRSKGDGISDIQDDAPEPGAAPGPWGSEADIAQDEPQARTPALEAVAREPSGSDPHPFPKDEPE